jgi:lipoate-protein ligase B
MVEVEVRRHCPDSPWTYAMLDRRQREIAARVRDGGEGALLLSEVAPVITVGRRTSSGDILFSAEEFVRRGVDVVHTDRGGFATYHGPGQWVLFAIDRLDRLTGDAIGVRMAVMGLLDVALEVGRVYRPMAEIRCGAELGVWSVGGKFAAVGVHVEQRVLLHGVAVNGFKSDTSFMGLRPCGLDAPVDFLLSVRDDEGFELLGRQLVAAALNRLWKGERQGCG